MSRAVPEWVADHPDQAIPTRVRVRVFERYAGVCQLTGRKITPADKWQLDHRIALVNGGAHAEHNLWPVLADAHKVKSREDVGEKAKTARVRAKHLGIWPKPKQRLRSRGFAPGRNKTVNLSMTDNECEQ